MRHPPGLLALAACIALTGSIAEAGPRRRKVSKKQAKPTEVARATEGESIDAPAKPSATATARRNSAWNFAIGPYVWASSVDANLTLGAANVATGVDFMTLTRHAKYGAMLMAEARYRKLSITGDLSWGVVEVTGDSMVGPLVVSLDGTVNNVLLEGNGGYRVWGDDHSVLSAEARAGVRYQRTSIGGTVGISGNIIAVPEQVDSGADGLLGGRVFVHPSKRLHLTGTFDVGVVGASGATWSAAADATYRAASFVIVTLGWRTMTTARPQVEIVQHGPRAAIQLVF